MTNFRFSKLFEMNFLRIFTVGTSYVVLEHRYYGKSIPTPDYSTQNMVYLSSEQALADAAYFILKTTKPVMLNSDYWNICKTSCIGKLLNCLEYSIVIEFSNCWLILFGIKFRFPDGFLNLNHGNWISNQEYWNLQLKYLGIILNNTSRVFVG